MPFATGGVASMPLQTRRVLLRFSRTSRTRILWIIVSIVIFHQLLLVIIPPSNLEDVNDDDTDMADIDDGFDKEFSYSTHNDRAEFLKHMQDAMHPKREEVVLSIFLLCSKGCERNSTGNAMRAELEQVTNGKVYDMISDGTTIVLEDPPIPIIGTNEYYRRIVKGADVSDFLTHVNAWRRIFHDAGGAGLVMSCELGNRVDLASRLRLDTWFRNKSEGGTMGEDSWDVLLIGRDGRANASSSISSLSREIQSVERSDILAYVVSKRGADKLLRHARAYTVPVWEFLSAVSKKGVLSMQWQGFRLQTSTGCSRGDGETKWSSEMPFYPPIHWLHATSRRPKGFGDQQ